MQLKKIFSAALLMAALLALLAGCDLGGDEHEHNFSKWATAKAPTCVDEGVQRRECEDCGYVQEEKLLATGHTTVRDAAVSATCTGEGLTEGSHCGTCGMTLVAQESIPAYGHAPLVDYPVEATCTSEGLTEGSHCALCGATITPQETVPASGHQYTNASVVMEATCVQTGIMKYSCTWCESSQVEPYTTQEHTPEADGYVAPGCETEGYTAGSHCKYCGIVLQERTAIPAVGHIYGAGVVVQEATCITEGVLRYSCTGCDTYYEENFPLEIFSADQILAQAQGYVGQLVTYDKFGKENSVGAAVVCTADGRIITSYAIIDGAYTAAFSLNGATYPVVSVLTYSRDLGLAVLQVEAADLPAADFCANPLSEGTTVYTMGASADTFSQGLITHASQTIGGVVFVQHDAPVTAACFGGPLINAYGEVVGISTVALSGNQNLAVFASEMDNLVYGTPLTMAEFYELECATAYEVLLEYIFTNGTIDADGNYTISQQLTDTDGRTTYRLIYDAQKDTVYLSIYQVANNGQTSFVQCDLATDPAAMAYSAAYGTSSSWYNNTTGFFDATAFTSGTKLSSTSYSGLNAVKDSLLSMYSDLLDQSLRWLSGYLTEQQTGITAAELGFANYN